MSQVSGSSWTPKTSSDQVKQQTKSVQKLSQGDQLCVENKFVEAVQEYVIILTKTQTGSYPEMTYLYLSVEFNAQVMVRTQVQLTSIELETDCVCKDTSKALKI